MKKESLTRFAAFDRGGYSYDGLEDDRLMDNGFSWPAVGCGGVRGEPGWRVDGSGYADSCRASRRRESPLRPWQGGIFLQRRRRHADPRRSGEHRRRGHRSTNPPKAARGNRHWPRGFHSCFVRELWRRGPLLRVGRERNSITLEANAHHLLTDVWTSVGVVAGVGMVALTGWKRLDPIVAFAVAANIIWTGVGIVRRSVGGLMDAALPIEDRVAVWQVLKGHEQAGVKFHALWTRQAGARKFISLHMLVPGDWTVQRGHQLLERIEDDIRHAVRDSTVFTHLESLSDPTSWDDETLDRWFNATGPKH